MAAISNKFAIYITGGRIFSMLAGFIMPVLLVRVMSQADYGLVSQFLTLYTAVYTIAALGIHTSVFYFCPSANKEQSDKYVSNTVVLLLAFGLLCGVILFIPPIKEMIFGDSELGKYSDLIILSIALATVMNVVSPLSTIRQDKWGALLIPGLVAFGRIFTIIVCAVLIKDMHAMFYWLFIFQLLITIAIILYSKLHTKFSVDSSLMKQQLLYSLPFGFSVGLQLLSNYFDKFVCIRYLTTVQYAIYGVAFLSIPGITQIYDSLCQVNIVNMSNSYRSGNTDEILPQYSNFVIKTLSFSTPIILVVALYAEEIMSFLYTDSYISSATYFRLYSLTFLTSMLGAGTILRSMGKTKYSMYAFIITCIIGLPSTYILVKYYGTSGAITGAMINMMLPRFIQMGFEVAATKSSIGKYLQWNKLCFIVGCSLLFLIPLVFIKYLFGLNIWWCILESGIYVIAVFAVLIHKDLFIIDKSSLYNIMKKITHKS